MEFTKDLKNRKISAVREFDAPPEEVWRAWTQSEILDQWWAPKPWKAVTKKMDFREGGYWLYAMRGPQGEEHFARVDYEQVVPNKTFSGTDYFTDASGNMNKDMPIMYWKCIFEKSNKGTVVNVEIIFDKESDLEKILEMGFKEGFESAQGNLEELLEQKQYHR